jgi:hypothetical protein
MCVVFDHIYPEVPIVILLVEHDKHASKNNVPLLKLTTKSRTETCFMINFEHLLTFNKADS